MPSTVVSILSKGFYFFEKKLFGYVTLLETKSS